jgi:hypothetical protein
LEDTFHFAGKDVLMSFGLLNDLTQLFGDPGRVAVLDFDPEMQDRALVLCLSERSARGRILKEYDLDNMPEFKPADAEAFFDWVKEHAVDFFIRRLKKSASLIEVARAR